MSGTEAVRIRRQQSVADDIEGAVHSCEFMCGSTFRTIHFPKKVNAEAVKAEYKNGILKIQAPLSKEQTRKIEIDAA